MGADHCRSERVRRCFASLKGGFAGRCLCGQASMRIDGCGKIPAQPLGTRLANMQRCTDGTYRGNAISCQLSREHDCGLLSSGSITGAPSCGRGAGVSACAPRMIIMRSSYEPTSETSQATRPPLRRSGHDRRRATAPTRELASCGALSQAALSCGVRLPVAWLAPRQRALIGSLIAGMSRLYGARTARTRPPSTVSLT
jgi:hypothetical protein